MGDADDVRGWLEVCRDDLLAELIGWVRIRSVMGPPEHAIDLRRSAQWLAGTLREVGFPTVEVWPTAGAPTVFAEWPASTPGAPTVLAYSHHDVRAAHEDTWEQTPPFEPTLREGRLFGRGTSDAKGQVLADLWGLRAWLAAGHEAPPVRLRMMVEGEKEAGSPHLAPAARRASRPPGRRPRRLLRHDAVGGRRAGRLHRRPGDRAGRAGGDGPAHRHRRRRGRRRRPRPGLRAGAPAGQWHFKGTQRSHLRSRRCPVLFKRIADWSSASGRRISLSAKRRQSLR